MSLLMTGLVVWFSVHLMPAVAKDLRRKLIVKLGMMPYKGIFALLIISSVVLMVFGWRSVSPEYLYHPPAWSRTVTSLIVLVAFILFVGAQAKTNIKRVLRHPQLTGLLLWCIGHLLANGDSRSLILFTALMIWGVLEMIFINRRDGEWKKPELVSLKNDVFVVIGGVVLFAVLLVAHPYLSGIRLLPG